MSNPAKPSTGRVLGVIGNPENINFWSCTPYFFLQAGKRAGFFDGGIPFDRRKLKIPRLLWNATAPFRGERFGGFQYDRACLEFVLDNPDKGTEPYGMSEIIGHFPLFPPFERMAQLKIPFSHYIDFPLPCLFDDYGVAQTIGRKTAEKALEREREQYAAARAVVCMSGWAARQVVERCGISPKKVHAILPGANLPEELVTATWDGLVVEESVPDGKEIPLRIAFVGVSPERKGLPQLVEGVRILARRGYQAILRVIGPLKNSYPGDPQVQHVGFINKAEDPKRLIQELKACHIGALPSRQEAFGIAALEYLRCGIPGLLTTVGGLQDSVPGDCAIFLTPTCTGEEIADRLEDLLKRPEYFISMRRQARNKATTASWDRAIAEFQKLWQTLD
jgi:glycosyltransferase involved in cell wall biosynthesis